MIRCQNFFAKHTLRLLLGAGLLCSFAAAQTAQTSTQYGSSTSSSNVTAPQPPPDISLFSGSRGTTRLDQNPFSLTMADAISLALKYNLGLYQADISSQRAAATRLEALSRLLPRADAHVGDSLQQINLAVYGFKLAPGQPSVVGPFNVVDARLSGSAPLIDISALDRLRSAEALGKAAQLSYADSREIVVLVVANLYLRTMAESSRVASAQADFDTASDVLRQTQDMKNAGVVAAIDLLRAQVEQQSRKQRLLAATTAVEKDKLALARAIGLPMAQSFTLADKMPYVPLPPISLETELQKALANRAEIKRAQELLSAAEFEHRAARAELLPSLELNGDYGGIGRSPGDMRPTYTAAATVRMPLFTGGRIHAESEDTGALVAQRKAELENVRGRIEQEVRDAVLDLQSNEEQVAVTRSAVELATQQLAQARDRFAAGVGTSLDVSQAEEALASSNEGYISSLYADNVAKATLARAVGNAEQAIKIFVGNR